MTGVPCLLNGRKINKILSCAASIELRKDRNSQISGAYRTLSSNSPTLFNKNLNLEDMLYIV